MGEGGLSPQVLPCLVARLLGVSPQLHEDFSHSLGSEEGSGCPSVAGIFSLLQAPMYWGRELKDHPTLTIAGFEDFHLLCSWGRWMKVMNIEISPGSSSLWCPCQAGVKGVLPSFEPQECGGAGGGRAQVSAGMCGGPGPLLLHSTPTLNSQQQLQELLSPWG